MQLDASTCLCYLLERNCRCDIGRIQRLNRNLKVERKATVMPIVRLPEIVFQPLPSHWCFQDLTGQSLNYLTVIGYAGNRGSGKRKHPYWFCACVCGSYVVTESSHFKSGHTASCGCRGFGLTSDRFKKHGFSGRPLFDTWRKMLSRCEDVRHKQYVNYGARGIRVCDRWRGVDGFVNFLSDMGEKPSPQHSLDRIDNDGNYEPGNCRWATKREQASNTRANRFIEFNNQRLTIKQWESALGFSRNVLTGRIDTRGWSVERAITTPYYRRKSSHLAEGTKRNDRKSVD